MSDDLNGDYLTIPVLGRKFTLGTLYDARSDIIVTDNNVSNLGAFKSTRNEGTTFTLIPSDKLIDKLNNLGVKDVHQIILLTDAIELQGSFKYLKKEKIEFHESRVHVRCHCRTATQELTSDQLKECKIRQVEDFTHVITKIQYGAEATFTLTKKLDETNDEHEAHSLLQNCANKLIEILCGVDVDDTTGINIKCHFEGDFLLPITFTTFEETIKFAKGFLHLLSNSIPKTPLDGSLGMACIAWLHPLTSALQCEMSDHVIEFVQQMEDYDEVEGKLDYFLNDSLAITLYPFYENLQVFQQHFNSFRNNHKTELRLLIVKNGLDQTANFKQYMQGIDNEQFEFNHKRLGNWLDEKYQELEMMKKYHNLITTYPAINSERVVIFPSADQLQQHMTNSHVNYGFELAFNWLSDSKTYFNPAPQDGVDWCEITKRIEKEITVITTLIQSKQNDDKFAFAITALDQQNESSLIVHQQHKKSYGWNAIDIICQHYPKLNLIDIVRLLTNTDIPDYWNHMNFLALCRFYDKDNLINLIRLFLERGVDLINCKTDDGWNALLIICRYYNKDNLFEIARLLLARGIDVNCKTNTNLNALHLVCRYCENDNLFEIVRLFFERGIDVNCQFEDGWNAFLFFCRNYQRDNLLGIIRLFIAQKVDVNYQTKGGNNALLFLCRYYDKKNLIEIIRLLLERGVNINCKNSEGWNALYLVCRYYDRENLIEIIRLFLKKGIDVNCINSEGWNSLHLVCRYYKRDNLINIIQLLLDKNIEINCKTNTGCNVLHNVCRYYPNDNLINIVQLLLDNGIFSNFTNNEGFNALLNVCKYYRNDNLIELVQLFIDEGIDVNWANNEGRNALHLICRYYKHDNVVDIIQLLIDNDIDVNSKTDDGFNALHFVCSRYYQIENLMESVELLIDNGISINCRTRDGWNALHNVCRYQRKNNMMQLIPLLIQHKIKITALTTGNKIENARAILLSRYKEDNVKDILQMLDSKVAQN